jgi:hypothetical protein
MKSQGLKPASIVNALRGAEAPLFHVTPCIPEALATGYFLLLLF